MSFTTAEISPDIFFAFSSTFNPSFVPLPGHVPVETQAAGVSQRIPTESIVKRGTGTDSLLSPTIENKQKSRSILWSSYRNCH